jgi:outer membrane immunogenic protein
MNQVFLRAVIGSLAGICLSAGGAAVAADLPMRAPAPLPMPPAFTWSGAYVGVQVGGGAGPTTIGVYHPFGQNFSVQSSGAFGGIHLGYNYQINSFVLGLQGEYNFAGVNGRVNNVSNSIRQFGSVDARLGMAFDRLLVYAIGGFAYADVRNSIQFPTPLGIDGNRDFIGSRPGWDVGGGLEYALSDNWTARAEYRYYNWGTKTFYDSVNYGVLAGLYPPHSTHDTLHTGRIGLTYKFGAPAAPVVARY